MSHRVASVLIVLFLTGWVVCAAGQKGPAATMNELSAVLASSCANQPTLTLAADGTIVRKDRDGATFTFKLRDIGAIAIDAPDAEANVLLRCKDDKPCVAVECERRRGGDALQAGGLQRQPAIRRGAGGEAVQGPPGSVGARPSAFFLSGSRSCALTQ